MAVMINAKGTTIPQFQVGKKADGSVLPGSVDFNLAPTTPITDIIGRLKWNDGDGTLDLGLKGGNVTLQIGQEQIVRILNNTGVTLTPGTVVYVTGSQGNRLTVGVADSSLATAESTIGVVTESILNATEGFIATFGLVRSLNTTAFTEGQQLWLDSAGGQIVGTRPSLPRRWISIGYCVRSHATVGSIFVRIDTVTDTTYTNTRLVSTSATIPLTDATVRVDCTAGNVTLTLPSAIICTGKTFTIKKIDNTSNIVIIDGNATDLVEDSLTVSIGIRYQSLEIQSNGTSWDII